MYRDVDNTCHCRSYCCLLQLFQDTIWLELSGPDSILYLISSICRSGKQLSEILWRCAEVGSGVEHQFEWRVYLVFGGLVK